MLRRIKLDSVSGTLDNNDLLSFSRRVMMGRALNVALLVAMLVLPMALTGCGGGGGDTTGSRTTLKPENLVPEVQVQEVDHRFRVAGWTQEVLDADPVFDVLNAAQLSLDIAIARLDRQAFTAALVAAAQRLGPSNVRVLTEKAYYDDNAYKPFYSQLEAAGIAVHTDKEGLPRVMHSRFIVVDQTWVVTGSYNWEAKEAEYTFGDVITILNTDVAAAFTNQFEQMYTEGLFGVSKRNDTNHSFLLGYVGGQAYGLLEVYFGPTDQPRELMESEIGQSTNVIFGVQQFSDIGLANYLLSWLGGNANGTMVGMMNNIGVLGGTNENNVYGAFLNYMDAPTGGQCYVNGVVPGNATGAARVMGAHPLVLDANFDNFATMNNKLMFADAGGNPTVMFTTSNYTDLGFTLNDEVLLVMRGESMMKKFWRGLDFQSTLPPDDLTDPEDVQELDSLMAMFPYMASAEAPLLKQFNTLPCGIIYGSVNNFRREMNIDDGNGSFVPILIDVKFEVGTGTSDELFFGGSMDFTAAVPEGTNAFVENELVNPDHRYFLVVPAGKITVRTTVVDDSGGALSNFTPEDTSFDIGPGCVKKVNLAISQAITQTTGGSGSN
jgi:mitochondrial cardiolipin hydrolase